MASFAKHCILILLLLTLLSSLQIHARDSQFFNKIPSNNGAKETQVVVPNNEETVNSKQVQEPNFIPENENGGYGLYGHESGQLPPSTTKTNLPYNSVSKESFPKSKYLPKNYNTVAYVTEPEGYKPDNNNNNFYNGENSYYNNEKQGLGENTYYNNEQQSFGETKLLGSSYTNPSSNNNNYGASNNYYNGQQQGMSDTRFNNNNYYFNGGNSNGAQKQGMSDTRFLENGKYYHDINTEQNFNRGPYGENVYRGYVGNSNKNSNYNEGYQNHYQFQNFQDEEDLP